MKSILVLPLLMVFAAGATLATPSVNEGGVLNAASYALDGLPHSGIAQGSLFVVFGTDMGPATLQQDYEWPLTTELAGTTVQVTVGSTTLDAIMIYTSALQVAAILPSSTPLGDGTLTVTYGGQASNAVNVHIVQTRFGIFARNQAGSGPAIAQNWVSLEDQPVNALTLAAHRNQVMVLWGTGLGSVAFDETQPPIAGNLPVDVEVWVGGKQAAVEYKGRSPSAAGVDQINFVIPADAPLGCYVPVAVRAAGVVSNFVTIAISEDGDVCSDTSGYSVADLQKAQTQGFLDVGFIELNRVSMPLGPFELTGDSGTAEFRRYEYSELLASQSISGTPSLGTCVVNSFRSEDLAFADPVTGQPLDTGPVLNLIGPLGQRQIVRQTMGYYGADLGGGIVNPEIPGYIVPGQYQVDNGTGGVDVRAFNASMSVPAVLEWTNQDSITYLIRTRAQQMTWEGGDPNGVTLIMGSSTGTSSQSVATFLCTEGTSVGQFTIPAYVLSALPASGVEEESSTVLLGVGHAPQLDRNAFQAQGLDVGIFSFIARRMRLMVLQ